MPKWEQKKKNIFKNEFLEDRNYKWLLRKNPDLKHYTSSRPTTILQQISRVTCSILKFLLFVNFMQNKSYFTLNFLTSSFFLPAQMFLIIVDVVNACHRLSIITTTPHQNGKNIFSRIKGINKDT